MVRVKGWSTYMELPYKTEFTIKNKSALGLGRVGLSVIKQLKDGWQHLVGDARYTGKWKVILRKYVVDRGQTYRTLRIFGTKEKAMVFAVKYMKEHPEG